MERGPVDEFELIYKTGAVQRIRAHQVSYPNNARNIFGRPDEHGPNLVSFHAEIEGRWRLMLTIDQADLISIRNVTQLGEQSI
jgi:hypothetical protein